MGYYSFVVWAKGEIQLPEVGVVLEKGTNVFNAVLSTAQLENLTAKMWVNGARLIKQSRLDGQDPLSTSDIAMLHDANQVDEIAIVESRLLVADSSEVAGSPEGPTEATAPRGDSPLDRDEPEGDGTPTD